MPGSWRTRRGATVAGHHTCDHVLKPLSPPLPVAETAALLLQAQDGDSISHCCHGNTVLLQLLPPPERVSVSIAPDSKSRVGASDWWIDHPTSKNFQLFHNTLKMKCELLFPVCSPLFDLILLHLSKPPHTQTGHLFRERGTVFLVSFLYLYCFSILRQHGVGNNMNPGAGASGFTHPLAV